MGKVVRVLLLDLCSIITCGICLIPPATLSTRSGSNIGGRVYGGRNPYRVSKHSNTTPQTHSSKSVEKTTRPVVIEEDIGSGFGEFDYNVQVDKFGLCRSIQWDDAQCGRSKCQNDTSCSGTKKCCPIANACRYTCQEPVNVSVAFEYSNSYLVGMAAEYRCQITAVYMNSGKPEVKWQYAGYDVTPTRNSRLQVTELQQVVSKYNSYTTSIKFKEILKSDSNKLLGCVAYFENIAIGDELLVQVATPSIEVEMRKVPFGNSTLINCYSNGPFPKVWCKDGYLLNSSPDAEIMTISPNVQTLMLRNLRKTAVYGCGLYDNKTDVSNIKCTDFQTVSVYLPEDQPCPQETTITATDKIFWGVTYPDGIAESFCSSGYTGVMTRLCRRDGNIGIWDKADNSTCINRRLSEIADKVLLINSGLASNTLNTLLSEVSNETNVIRNKRQWRTDELSTSLKIIQTVANIAEDRSYKVSEQELQDFVNTVNNIVDPATKDTWTTLADERPTTDVSAPTVMRVMTSFGHSAVKGLEVGLLKRVKRNNIVVEARRSNVQGDVTFFGQDIKDQNALGDYITLTKETILNSGLAENGSVDSVGVYYSTLSSFLSSMKRDTWDSNNSTVVNDAIISFSLTSGPKKNLDPPVKLSFHQQEVSFLRTKCVFWDFEKTGDWSTEGCKLVSTTDNATVCECDHLTNFAILMSPYNKDGVHHKVLSIMSIIGCSISLAGVIITVFCYVTVWRHVKSEKSWLLMNLCVSLSLALVVFLVGVEQTQNKVLCNVVSGMLHYLFLCVFFLMLAEGISVAVSVVNVFARRSKLRYLLPMAWGMPAVIVGITFGVGGLPTNKKFCWLSIDDRFQLLAFIIPALGVILANVIITIIVLRALFSTRAVMTKTQKEKIKTGLRSVAVLAPIFGLTWVFGVLSVNESTRLFQYLFVIFNSLQGLFIFIFHCLLNKTVKDTFCIKNRRKGSLTSQTPASKKDTKPVSESPLQNNYSELTLETPDDIRGTTTTFSNPKCNGNEIKDKDIPSEKQPLPNIEENKDTKQDLSNDTLEITRL